MNMSFTKYTALVDIKINGNAIKRMRWKCVCAYEGTNFCGWQSQPNGNGVQDHIEARLAAVFKRFVRIHGSSRTDAGVHALGQVANFKTNST